MWAFAQAGCSDELVFVLFAKAAEGRLAEFNAMEVANTVWALANVTMSDALLSPLFAGLVRW